MSSTDNDNSKTLASYNHNFQPYLDDQPTEVSKELQNFIKAALHLMPKSGYILELGSGTGRDAKWIESQGYHIQASDAAQSLFTRLLNALTDEYGGPYDLIYASALLDHFDKSQTEFILQKMHEALKSGGIAAIRTKVGHKTEWTNEKLNAPRYMHYYTERELLDMLTRAGFAMVKSYQTADGYDNKGIPWLHVIAKRI